MPNPYLPLWEYIPDGEPKVFGNRVYVYGSHDRAAADTFCDYRLKVWSAPLDDLNHWVCHGTCFQTRANREHPSDTPWTDHSLFAPDVCEKNGRYYLYAYIVGAYGCVAVADRPEGPFRLLGQYQVPVSELKHGDDMRERIFIDPGVLVDDDGRTYVYCGFIHSFMCELEEDMRTVKPDTYQRDIIPEEEPYLFYEACSPIRIGDTYYLIYSPKCGSQLVYATSDSPTGPFRYRGVIVDNGVDYPGGNNHGCICKVGGQWYIFYHRMTNGTCMSRRGCVERIDILPDGTIPQVEMTSLGFQQSLNPYEQTPAELACVLKGGCCIVERNAMMRPVVDIKPGCVIGYKYFDFGEDDSGTGMNLLLRVRGLGQRCRVHVRLDGEDGEEIGCADIGLDDGFVSVRTPCVTGRHAVYFTFELAREESWIRHAFENRNLLELEGFVFMK